MKKIENFESFKVESLKLKSFYFSWKEPIESFFLKLECLTEVGKYKLALDGNIAIGKFSLKLEIITWKSYLKNIQVLSFHARLNFPTSMERSNFNEVFPASMRLTTFIQNFPASFF